MIQNELQENVSQVTQAAEAVSISKQASFFDKCRYRAHYYLMSLFLLA